MENGEVNNDEGREMAAFNPEPTEASFEAIAKRDGIPSGVAVRCSYDTTTEEGAGFLARASVSQAEEEDKLPYYGKSFNMVAWTSIIRTMRKDKKTGNMLPEPRPIIRTVIECDDTTEIASCSSYMFADLQQISMAHPNLSIDNPVECVLYKGGAADRIKDVKASMPRKIPKKK